MATRKLTVEILGDSRSLEKAFGRSEKAGADFGRKLRTGAIAAAAAVAGIAVGATKVVNAASNLNEQLNKSNVVFGKNADAIADWSKTTADAFGISQRAALEAAGGFGQMLQSAGVTQDAAAGMSKKLVELAADLASFNNIDPTEALEKLRSGLAGEAEPLRRMGVFLSETAVKQEAYRDGIAKVGAELTEAQKVQARYNLILRQTGLAQGDFARTSTSLANSTRRVSAQLEDAAARIGAKFLPFVARASDAFANLLDDLGKAKTIGAKFDVVVSNVRQLTTRIANQIGNAVRQINWTRVFKQATGIAAGLQARLAEVDFSIVGERIGDAFSDAAKVALPAAKQIAERLSGAVREIDWEDLGRAMGPGLATAVTVAFTTLLDPAFWARNWDLALAIALAVFGDGIGKVALKGAGLFVDLFAKALARFSPELGAAFRGLAIQMVRLFGAALATAVRVAERVLRPLIGVVRNLFNRLGRIARFTVRVLGIQAVIDVIAGLVRDVAAMFKRLGSLIGDVMRDAIRKVLEFVNKVLGVTAVLGRFDPFKGLRSKIQRQLDAMEADVDTTVSSINRSLGSIKDQTVRVALNIDVRTSRIPGGGAGRRPEEGALAAETVPEDIDRATRALGARYNAMAAAYNRMAREAATKAEAVRKAREKATAAAKRAAARARAAATRQRQAFEDLTDALEVQVETALGRGGRQRALDLLRQEEATINQQIRIEGRTTDLLRRLNAVQEEKRQVLEDISTTARDATQVRQFRMLGLTATGDKPLPGLENLIKQWQSLSKRIDGTPLEKRFAGALKRVGNVLKKEGKQLQDGTKQAILGIFDAIREGFNEGAKTVTRMDVQALNANKVMQGLGLSAEEMEKLRARLSKFTAAGTTLAPKTRATAFGMVVSGPQPITIENTLILDGDVIGRSVKRYLQGDGIKNPKQKRGPNAGRR